MSCMNMAELKMHLVSLFGILVLALPVLCDHGVLEVFCETKLLSPNVSYTFQDVCGQHASVFVYLEDQENDTFPWTIYAGINDTKNGEMSIISADITRYDIEMFYGDVSYLLAGQVVTILNTEFDGRTVVIGVTLVDAKGEQEYKQQDERRLIPNFNYTDIQLGFFAYVPWINLNDSSPTLGSAMQSSDFDVLIEGWVTGPLPEPLEVAAGYFVGAYVQPASYWKRKKRQAYGNYTLFDQRIVIGRPLLYRSGSELQAKVEELYEIVRNSDITLYGSGELVIDADVFNTAWNQKNQTNDVVRFQYYSSLSSPQMAGPACSIIKNPWTTGDAGFFRDSVYNVSMYEASSHRDFYVHDEEDGWRMHMEEEEKKGYFYLAMLQAYLEDPSNLYLSECTTSVTDDDLINYLNENEETEEYMESPIDGQLESTLIQMKEMMDGYMTPDVVINNMQTQIYNQPYIFDPNINETVSSAITMAFFNETMKLAMAKMNDSAQYLKTISTYRPAACGLTEFFKQGRGLLHNTSVWDVLQDPEIKTYLKDFAQHVASLTVLSEATAQPSDGLRYLLNGIKRYAEDLDKANTVDHVETMTFEALFKNEDLDREAATNPNECAQWPSYAQKFASLCHVPDTATISDIITSKEDVCKTFAFRKLAKDIWRNLGLKNLTEYWEGKDDQKCVRDALNPKDGPSTIWKIDDVEGVVYQGVLSLDKSSVYWTKKAVCSCQVCNNGGSGGTTGGMNWGTGTTHPWSMPTGWGSGSTYPWGGPSGPWSGWNSNTGTPSTPSYRRK